MLKKVFIITIFLIPIHAISGWQLVDSMPTTAWFFKISCYDTNNCTAAGNFGFFYPGTRVTSDGGKTWKTTLNDDTLIVKDGDTLRPGEASDIEYPGPSTCIITCIAGNIWLSKDGAQSWKKSRLPRRDVIYSLKMINENFGGLTTYWQLYLTYDGGLSWDSVSIAINDTTYKPELFQCLEITSDSAIIINAYRKDKESYIIRSEDLGKTWEAYPPPKDRFWRLHFINSKVGFTVGTYKSAPNTRPDVVFKTIDGGKTWVKKLDTVLAPYQKGLLKLQFADSLLGFAYGEFYHVWKTTDGGETWNWDTSFSENKFTNFLNHIEMPSRTVFYGTQSLDERIFKYTESESSMPEVVPDYISKIYPNPIIAGDELYLEFKTNGCYSLEIKLFNSLGQTHSDRFYYIGHTPVRLKYNTSELSPGLYFISVKTTNNIRCYQFIVK